MERYEVWLHWQTDEETGKIEVKWYRSTFYNITILGLCNFSAPGIWSAMNSLGAGGTASPHLTNTANALTFCLMVVSCFFSSALVHYIGIKGMSIRNTVLLFIITWLTAKSRCFGVWNVSTVPSHFSQHSRLQEPPPVHYFEPIVCPPVFKKLANFSLRLILTA